MNTSLIPINMLPISIYPLGLDVPINTHNTSFFQACSDGNTQHLHELLGENKFTLYDGEQMGDFLQRGLIRAIARNHIETVRILLAHSDIIVNICLKNNKNSPLVMAVHNKNDDIVKMLLDHPAIDVNEHVGNPLCTVLNFAVYWGKTECVKHILAHPKINVGLVDVFDRTPLQLAIHQMEKTFDDEYREIIDMLHLHMGVYVKPSIHLKMPVPPKTEDVIYGLFIENGCVMADFHGEREFGRYYTKASYKTLLQPKRNPVTRQPILPSEVVFYIAEVSSE